MCVINFELTDSQRMYDAFVENKTEILEGKPSCFLTYHSSIHDLHERYSNWLDSYRLLFKSNVILNDFFALS